jgi:hypothetical protein
MSIRGTLLTIFAVTFGVCLTGIGAFLIVLAISGAIYDFVKLGLKEPEPLAIFLAC